MTLPTTTQALTVNEQPTMQIIRGYMHSPQMIARFSDVVGKHNAGAYISSALLAVANNETLQKCKPESIAVSAMRAATLRLSCDPGIGEAYIVPFKNTATLVIGYKGLREMAIRTGQYRYLNVATIYEGEEVEIDKLSGECKITGSRTGDRVLGRLAYYKLVNGFEKSLYMTTEEIHAHAKRYSKSYNYDSSVWKSFKTGDPDNPMEIKTPFRLLIQRWGFLDPQDRMRAGLNQENTDDVIDAEGMDVPDVAEVTITEEPKRTQAQNMADLGFGGDATKYKTDGQTIIARIALAKDMTSGDATALIAGLLARHEIPDMMTIAEADAIAGRLNV